MTEPPVAFRYRRRYGAPSEQLARLGDTIVLDERNEYVVWVDRPLSASETSLLVEIGGETVQSNVALLSFGNFVGTTTFLGVRLNVVSTKLGDGGASRLLDEISQLAAALVFGWRSPTSLEGGTARTQHSPVPYHQLQFVRDAMMRRPTGTRLQDWLEHISKNATRRFESHRPLTSVDRVRHLDNRALISIFTRLDRLASVPAANISLTTNHLATALTFGHPPKRHFPATIAAPQTRLSFDTPENRFARHAVRELLGIVGRFASHPKLHLSLRRDCATMLALLETAATAPHLAEAGTITALQAPTQALAKAEGYRDLFAFWSELTRHVSLPPSPAETARMLEGRDIATLYEYWVYLKVLETSASLLGFGTARPPKLVRSDLDERLGYGCTVDLGEHVSVEFNGTYSRTLKTAYSTPLRPDVVVRVGAHRYAFDAKYRLDRLSMNEDDPDDAVGLTYKRADLYKMHTYRDAIHGMRAAFVVFPGTEFAFFERSGKAHRTSGSIDTIAMVDGVGAVPLRPADADPTSTLRGLLSHIFDHALPRP